MKPIISIILLSFALSSCHPHNDDPVPATNTFSINGVLYHASSAIRPAIDTLIITDSAANTALRITNVATTANTLATVYGYYINNWKAAATREMLFIVVQAFKDGKTYTTTGNDQIFAATQYANGMHGYKFTNAWALNDSLATDSVQVSCDVADH